VNDMLTDAIYEALAVLSSRDHAATMAAEAEETLAVATRGQRQGPRSASRTTRSFSSLDSEAQLGEAPTGPALSPTTVSCKSPLPVGAAAYAYWRAGLLLISSR
jgi:hypothetical protein